MDFASIDAVEQVGTVGQVESHRKQEQQKCCWAVANRAADCRRQPD